jgi:hypothetical protein
MSGQYELDSGDKKHHLTVEGPRLTRDRKIHQAFQIIYTFLVWNATRIV